jgi:deoxyribonuclease-1-like protein
VKLSQLFLVLIVGVAGWYVSRHYRLRGMENIRVETAPAAGSPATDGKAPPSSSKSTIRIASINFGPLDAARLARPGVSGQMVQLLRDFDVIALQDIRGRDQATLVKLLELLNAGGRHFDSVLPEQVGRDPVETYLAFVFDSDTIQVDRRTVATVDNRAQQFRHPPLLALFRAKAVPEKEAFTFFLINVHTPSDRVSREVPLLAQVFRTVRDGPQNEDDVILLGEIGVGDADLMELGQIANITCAIEGKSTVTRVARTVDNILFDRRATIEYTHRSDAIDVMRQFNLPLSEAANLTEHLPIWAEFHVREGGPAGLPAAP